MNLARYSKTIASVVVAVLGWWDFVINSAPKAITAGEWHLGAVMLAGALGVFAVPNAPKPVADPPPVAP